MLSIIIPFTDSTRCANTHCEVTQPDTSFIANIVQQIPADKIELREEFLRNVWNNRKKTICAKLSDPTINEEMEWDNLLEDTKAKIQQFIQKQDISFFGGAISTTTKKSIPSPAPRGGFQKKKLTRHKPTKRKKQTYEIYETYKPYYQYILDNQKAFNQHLEYPYINSLVGKTIKSLKNISIKCPGCALTYDLIMYVLRYDLPILQQDPTNAESQQRLQKLHTVLSNITDTEKPLAHKLRGLPEIITASAQEVQRCINYRSELTDRDIQNIRIKIETMIERKVISPFHAPSIRDALNRTENKHPKELITYIENLSKIPPETKEMVKLIIQETVETRDAHMASFATDDTAIKQIAQRFED